MDDPFDYTVRKSGDVVISRGGRVVTVLRGSAAGRFLRDVERRDPQQLMARLTGNYKRGNERKAKSHPRHPSAAATEPNWERADRCFTELRLGLGQPVGEVPTGELRRALHEQRVLTLDASRDGFGGGSVRLSLPGPDDADDLWGNRPAFHRFSLVFDVLPIDDEVLRVLNGNAWESLREIPGFDRVWHRGE